MEIEPKKRGRKPKQDEPIEKSLPKKRGRKPKGGKIITNITNTNFCDDKLPNIIVHLKCSLQDLDEIKEALDTFHFNKNELEYQEIQENSITNEIVESKEDINSKILCKKIKQLKHQLHNNDIYEKKSSCFWCTFPFSTPLVHIPKFYHKGVCESYGCFCSPECAAAHLMNENIDMTTKFERYYLLNNMYGKIYNYKKNIKPAPSPYYMLDKYFGNLTIEEYRNLYKLDKLFVVLDKPLTRSLPELHEDNDEFILNTKLIPSSNIKQRYSNILTKA
jgi:hypothetical protein